MRKSQISIKNDLKCGLCSNTTCNNLVWFQMILKDAQTIWDELCIIFWAIKIYNMNCNAYCHTLNFTLCFFHLHQYSIIISFYYVLHQSKAFIRVYTKSQEFWNFIRSWWHSLSHLVIKKSKGLSSYSQCIVYSIASYFRGLEGDGQEYCCQLNLCRILIVIEN